MSNFRMTSLDDEDGEELDDELEDDVFVSEVTSIKQDGFTNSCEIDYSTANKWPQILAAQSAAFSAFAMGTNLGWSSPVQPQLQQNSTLNSVTDMNSSWYIYMNDDQMSWVGSLINMGALIGAIFGGFLIDKFGRLFVLMLLSAPYLAGWFLITLAIHPSMLYIGRILSGIAIGITCAAAPCYIGEITTPNLRGTVGFFFSANITIGILFSSCLGLWLDWRWISGISAIIPLLLLIFLSPIPESPHFLVKTNNLAKASKALEWLRGSSYNVETELAQIKARVREDGKQELRFSDFFSPWAYKPILIGVAMMFFQQFSGMNAALFYSVDILNVAGSDLDALIAAVIVIITMFAGVLVGAWIVTCIGRRPLLMIAELICCLSLVVLGAYFYILENYSETAKLLFWLPLVSLMVFIFVLGFAIGPLPWLVSSEVLPTKIRGQGSAIVALANFGFSFIVTKTFIDIQRVATTAGAFWFYGGICFTGIIFAYFILPETKDKSADEIDAIFRIENKNDL